MNRILATFMLLALVWGATACGSEDAAIYMAEARSVHQRAERALASDDHAGATDEWRAFLDVPVPQSVNGDDARVVRQDVSYRLANLALDRGDTDAAIRWAEQGLNEGLAEDVFTANLYVVRGAARQAAGRDIDAASDYHEALLINDALLQRLLGAGDSE